MDPVLALALRRLAAVEAELSQARAELQTSQQDLEAVRAELSSLSGLLPMCAWCKKIRDDDGYWQQVEGYLANRTDAEFSHAMCPDCFDRIQADMPDAKWRI